MAGLDFLFLLLFAPMPATYYATSSFLVGAFLSSLAFCHNHDIHVRFVSQFKRLLQWLMCAFFCGKHRVSGPAQGLCEQDGHW